MPRTPPRSLDRTYEELKLGIYRENPELLKGGLDRTYEELKLNCVAWRKTAEYMFGSYL